MGSFVYAGPLQWISIDGFKVPEHLNMLGVLNSELFFLWIIIGWIQKFPKIHGFKWTHWTHYYEGPDDDTFLSSAFKKWRGPKTSAIFSIWHLYWLLKRKRGLLWSRIRLEKVAYNSIAVEIVGMEQLFSLEALGSEFVVVSKSF